MTQCRVNNLMVLNIHKDQCEELDLVDVANAFVAGSSIDYHYLENLCKNK